MTKEATADIVQARLQATEEANGFNLLAPELFF